MKKVAIIGAGIAGLAAGWYHQKCGHTVTLYEQSERPGGWIQTIEKEGFLFEIGPRGFRSTGKGAHTLALVKELGLEQELISAENSRRYIGREGVLKPLRPNFTLGLALLRDLLKRPTRVEDETIGAFCRKRLSEAVTKQYVDPVVRGIFGGDLEELSIRSCFPNVWRAGSFVRTPRNGKPKLYSFKNGMETLPKALAERLDIRYNSRVTPDELDADEVIVAAPAYGISERDPFSYATLTTVSLGWNAPVLHKKGFGFLIPSSSVLGMTWDSSIFPERYPGSAVCVMIQGEGSLEIALETVQSYLGVETLPDVTHVECAQRAIPQYLFGHHKRLAHFQKRYPYKLIGNCYTGVGVNDCIEAAWTSAS